MSWQTRNPPSHVTTLDWRALDRITDFGILLVGVDGHVTHSNRAFARLFDRPPSMIVGESFLQLVAPQHRRANEENFAALRNGGDDVRMLNRFLHPETGAEIPKMLHAVRARADGEMRFLLFAYAYGEDHGMRDRIARLEEALAKTVGALSGNVTVNVTNQDHSQHATASSDRGGTSSITQGLSPRMVVALVILLIVGVAVIVFGGVLSVGGVTISGD